MMSATASLAATHLMPLAAKDLDQNKVTPGLLGFVIFAVIGGAVWLLMKSMTKQLKRVDFEETAEAEAPAAAAADAKGGGTT